MQDAAVSARSRAPEPLATCSVRVVQPFARYLAHTGRDAAGLLQRHGLSWDALADRDLRLPHRPAMALLSEAMAIAGEPAIGIHAAACEQPGDFDVMEYAAANCATVGEALQLAARFIPLMHDGITMTLEVAPPLAVLRARVAPGVAMIGAGVEFLFASLLSYGARSLGHATRPLRVEFAHAAPPDPAPYDAAFREARFGCSGNAMWLTSAALALPHCAPDRSLLQILTHHADDRLRALPVRPSFADRTRAVIAETLHACGAEQVARRLAVSLRTLHRRLAEEGASHGELVDDVRRSQAMLHLRSERFSIGEIAFLLGFAHPNAFHKAFKRWTQITPAQYRAQTK